jgi:peptidyl-prolyl cis-trans isomerase B (cyclophilin B)
MTIKPQRCVLAALVSAALAGPALAEAPGGVQTQVRINARQVPLNQPVWAHFSIENVTSEPVTLTVPGAEPDLPSPEMGLPLSHVFSGSPGRAAGVTVTTESGRAWSEPMSYEPGERAPILLLAPFSTVGRTIDLREYFPALRGAGVYRVNWSPYGGEFPSAATQITIAPRKQVELTTDEGKLTVQLFYDDAPMTVENFLDLAKAGFYTSLTFHRLEPGYLIQGGCPRGDGTGIRLDGKRVPSEIGSQVHKKGSVSMALLGDDSDSASCQFFISNTRMKEWDGKYTVFGELVGDESYTTLDRLMQIAPDEQGRPKKPILMRTVRVTDAPVDSGFGG